MNHLVSQTLEALTSVIGLEAAPLHAPQLGDLELEYVTQCVKTGWVSTVGSFVTQIEDMLCEITGAHRAVACCNGTSALFIALKMSGVEPQDEVLVPALTFVATANAIAHCNAIPHVVDVDNQTLGIDPDKLQTWLKTTVEKRAGRSHNRFTGRPISAIVPMHCFGHPSAIEQIVSIANDFQITVVEDAAESLGSTTHGRHVGTFGKAAAISFNGNKIVTTGGGGAILTNDRALADRIKHITTTAKVPHQWNFHHDEVGYNLRMPNINAALGCAQLSRLDQIVTLKRSLAESYRQALDAVDGLSFFREPRNCRSNYWLNAIVLDEINDRTRDELLRQTNQHGFMTRPAWTLINQLPMFKDSPAMDLSTAESLQRRLINIPSGVSVAQRIAPATTDTTP